MLIPSLIVVAVVVAVLVFLIARQPSTFKVVRSAAVPGPPEDLFEHVNDLRSWEAWSPWAKRDPTMRQTYDGPPAGVGATSEWSGNREVGAGRMTITESVPHERVGLRLDFLKPFAATHTAEFTFAPDGDRTVVTWSMSGDKIFASRVICLFMDMDKMIGRDFEQGLAALAALAAVRPAMAAG
ncbi:MAG: hypothetical protein AVDCRST_MAG64-2427 [uncultured Phycisphaerae bacterium]|uniref:Polyketide cyclase n=1 Tax=uncultured Phycisphaerae bacterium TaxID=904963 RepID=A0A6J4PGD3_9BACT|nr:MAG: hypothetical protein AVDCRST_MAG64-2427 [uncultured Phycisphaerae bacterium]